MQTPEKAQQELLEGGLKSHRVMGLDPELTPPHASSNKGRQASPGEYESPSSGANVQGGGVTGMIKSLLGGQGAAYDKEQKGVDGPKSTYQTEALDGRTATVETSPGTATVPEALESVTPHPSGTASTKFEEPVSDFAPALEKLAGEPEAADPTKKFGPALDSITGATAPAAGGGVVGALSAAAGSAVETLKQAAGYGTQNGAARGSHAASGTIGSEVGAVNVKDLPKSSVITATEDGSASVAPKEAAPTGFIASAAGTISGGAQYVKETVSSLTGSGATTAGTESAGIKPVTPPPENTISVTESPADIPKADPGIETLPSAVAAESTSVQEVTPNEHGKLPVSVFATESEKKGRRNQSEINEEELPPANTTVQDDAKIAPTNGDKAKAPACGCCSIS